MRALDFPKDERDREGFEALRQILDDRDLTDLIRAAEDMLNMFAKDGLYMEDLEIETAPLDAWKRYAKGARGAEVAAVGGVRDEVALAIMRSKKRADPIFRAAALHFLKRYDKLVRRMFDELGDDPIVLDAANTRTGRAFMVLARVVGAFD